MESIEKRACKSKDDYERLLTHSKKIYFACKGENEGGAGHRYNGELHLSVGRQLLCI